MMFNSLSPDEQVVLDCLRDYLDTYHYSPSIQELQVLVGKRSRSTLQELLKQLHEKGWIDWDPDKCRTYHLLRRGVPVLGVIQAGRVVEHPSDLVEWLEIPGINHKGQEYALRVCGDSMIDAHICENDFVLIRPDPDLWTLKRTAICVVWVEGEGTTLKYVEADHDWVLLKPANQQYPIRKVAMEQIQLQGVVVRVVRDYEVL